MDVACANESPGRRRVAKERPGRRQPSQLLAEISINGTRIRVTNALQPVIEIRMTVRNTLIFSGHYDPSANTIHDTTSFVMINLVLDYRGCAYCSTDVSTNHGKPPRPISLAR